MDTSKGEWDSTQRMPVGYVGHGSPVLAIDPKRGAPLKAWGEALPVPTALLVVSAHWEHVPLTIGHSEAHTELFYDFGMPYEDLYRVKYSAPGAPVLADAVEKMLKSKYGGVSRSDRLIDHGVWTPLVHMWPDADVPLLQLSMPDSMTEAELFGLGRTLAPLRDEGVFILGSGNITHNLRDVDWTETAPPVAYAQDFDQWAKECMEAKDFDALIDWREGGPAAATNHPTPDHYRPLMVTLGAAEDSDVTFPVEGFEHKSISRRSVQLG